MWDVWQCRSHSRNQQENHAISSQVSYGPWKTWKVMAFQIFNFQAWKIEINHLSWKVMEKWSSFSSYIFVNEMDLVYLFHKQNTTFRSGVGSPLCGLYVWGHAAGYSMVFGLSVLNRIYNFYGVCPEQGMVSTIIIINYGLYSFLQSYIREVYWPLKLFTIVQNRRVRISSFVLNSDLKRRVLFCTA